MTTSIDLTVDPQRMGNASARDVKTAAPYSSGIWVRAKLPNGSYAAVDIAWLDYDSLMRWLRSRGGDNPWAEKTVAMLLGWTDP